MGLHGGREGVLQPHRLLVDEVPGHPHHIDEEALQNAVAPHHRLGQGEAVGGETDLATGIPGDQTLLLKLAEHMGDGWGLHAHPAGEARGNHGLAPRREVVDHLEVLPLLGRRALLAGMMPATRVVAPGGIAHGLPPG